MADNWTCLSCTYDNDAGDAKCICGSTKPTEEEVLKAVLAASLAATPVPLKRDGSTGDGGAPAPKRNKANQKGESSSGASPDDCPHLNQFVDAVCSGTPKAILRRLCEDARQGGIVGLWNLLCFKHEKKDGRT
jgi:hypothetical protein